MIAVNTQNHTKATSTKCRESSCYSKWYISLPLGFKWLKRISFRLAKNMIHTIGARRRDKTALKPYLLYNNSRNCTQTFITRTNAVYDPLITHSVRWRDELAHRHRMHASPPSKRLKQEHRFTLETRVAYSTRICTETAPHRQSAAERHHTCDIGHFNSQCSPYINLICKEHQVLEVCHFQSC
jgi:hypothetical protein